MFLLFAAKQSLAPSYLIPSSTSWQSLVIRPSLTHKHIHSHFIILLFPPLHFLSLFLNLCGTHLYCIHYISWFTSSRPVHGILAILQLCLLFCRCVFERGWVVFCSHMQAHTHASLSWCFCHAKHTPDWLCLRLRHKYISKYFGYFFQIQYTHAPLRDMPGIHCKIPAHIYSILPHIYSWQCLIASHQFLSTHTYIHTNTQGNCHQVASKLLNWVMSPVSQLPHIHTHTHPWQIPSTHTSACLMVHISHGEGTQLRRRWKKQ